jgi:hypothetical protein
MTPKKYQNVPGGTEYKCPNQGSEEWLFSYDDWVSLTATRCQFWRLIGHGSTIMNSQSRETLWKKSGVTFFWTLFRRFLEEIRITRKSLLRLQWLSRVW